MRDNLRNYWTNPMYEFISGVKSKSLSESTTNRSTPSSNVSESSLLKAEISIPL